MKILFILTLSYIFNKLYIKTDKYIKKDVKKHCYWYFKHCKTIEFFKNTFSILSELLFYFALMLIIIWIIKGEYI